MLVVIVGLVSLRLTFFTPGNHHCPCLLTSLAHVGSFYSFVALKRFPVGGRFKSDMENSGRDLLG